MTLKAENASKLVAETTFVKIYVFDVIGANPRKFKLYETHNFARLCASLKEKHPEYRHIGELPAVPLQFAATYTREFNHVGHWYPELLEKFKDIPQI